MGLGYITLPTDDKIPAAALAMTNQDANYPVGNAQDDDPANTAKATGTSTVVTITTPSITAVLYSVINTNATSISLTNGAGMAAQAQAIPSRTLDGKQRNGFKYFAGVALATSTTWTLTMSKTGAQPLEFGRIVLVVAVWDLKWLRGVDYDLRRPGAARNVTRLGTVNRRLSPVSQRSGNGQFLHDDAFTVMANVEAGSNGLGNGFLVVPDRDVNDAMFMQVAEDAIRWKDQISHVDLRLPMEEITMGLPPNLA